MKLILKLSLSFLAIICFACEKNEPVVACIEIDKQSISTGESITFTSCSENEWSYLWEITGPDSAAENSISWNDRIVVRQFDTPGSYKV